MSSEIADCVKRSVNRYFRDLDGEQPTAIYDMVLRNVEHSLFEVVMDKARGNQTVAADMLGINRNTLRRKLCEYGLL